MRKRGKITQIVLGVLVIAFLSSIVVFQLPKVQTAVAKRALSTLEENMDANLEIGSVSFKPMNTIVVNDLLIRDRTPQAPQAYDTLLYVVSLSARFSFASLFSQESFRFKNVKLNGGEFNLVVREPATGSSNVKRIFNSGGKKSDGPNAKELFRIENFSSQGLRYRMLNLSRGRNRFDTAIQWTDVDVTDVCIKARDVSLKGGVVRANVTDLKFHEKSGFDVLHMCGKVRAGQAEARITDVILDDGESHAEFDYAMLGNTQDFKDYVNKVFMEIHFKRSHFSLRTLCRFIPPLNCDSTTFLTVKGRVDGPVCNLKASNLRLDFDRSGLGCTLDGEVTHLPDVQNMGINADVTALTATTASVNTIVNAIAPKAKMDILYLCKKENIGGTVSTRGTINDLRANICLTQQGKGSAELNAHIQNAIDKEKNILVDASLATDDLDIGAILGNLTLGPATLSTDISANIPRTSDGKAAKSIRASIEGAKAESVNINGHDFRNLSLNAWLDGKDLTADFHSKDSALDADLSIWTDKSRYHANADIRSANLLAMKLDRRGKSHISLNVAGSLDKDLSNLSGDAVLSNIALTNETGEHKISDIRLSADTKDNWYDLYLDSDFANGYFTGNPKEAMDLNLITGDSRELFAFLMPGMYLESGTRLKARVKENGAVSGAISSGRVAFKKNFIKGLTGTISGTRDDILADVEYNTIQIGDLFNIQGNHITANYADSTIALKYIAANPKDQEQNAIDLDAALKLGGKGTMGMTINPSMICLKGRQWEIPAAAAQMKGKSIQIDSLCIQNGSQMIFLDGNTSETKADTMNVHIRDVDISILNDYLSKDLSAKGRMSAECSIFSPMDGTLPNLMATIACDSLSLGGTMLGNLEGECRHEAGSPQLLGRVSSNINGNRVLLAGISMDPKTSDKNVVLHLDEFPIGFAQPLIPKVFYDMDGTISGNCTIDLPKNGKARIRSRGTRLNDVKLGITYTHVPYFVDGTFHLDEDGLHLDKTTAHDRFGSPAILSGGVKWDSFRNMALDLGFKVTDIEALNIPQAGAEIFYGQIFATGSAAIQGPLKGLVMDVNARTTKPGNLHIALGGTKTTAKSNLLTFVNPFQKEEEDPYVLVLEQLGRKKDEGSRFKIKIHAQATPDVQAYLDMDAFSQGTGLSGNGTGNLDMEAGADGFKIRGDYALSEGVFGVSASNIIRRDFTIKEGSSIKFGGDVLESTVDLSAYYSTKASIATLISDTTSVSNRRIVECGIALQNKLKSPDIKFSINVPDLDPSVKSRVESALSTEDKVQKQFLSLLLSNSFLPDEQSGIVNNNSLLYSNVSEIMANQINNIFGKLEIPLDLGLNYQPNDKGGRDEFDVAISTQLWNNRVIIGGQFGNRQSASSAKSSLFGDLDVQIKLNRTGEFRLNLFSHSADQYSNYLDNSQRNGAGITWQQEFDRFPEFFRNLFSSRAQKEAFAEMEAQRAKETQTLILDE